jgi:hypothetical protein
VAAKSAGPERLGRGFYRAPSSGEHRGKLISYPQRRLVVSLRCPGLRMDRSGGKPPHRVERSTCNPARARVGVGHRSFDEAEARSACSPGRSAPRPAALVRIASSPRRRAPAPGQALCRDRRASDRPCDHAGNVSGTLVRAANPHTCDFFQRKPKLYPAPLSPRQRTRAVIRRRVLPAHSVTVALSTNGG